MTLEQLKSFVAVVDQGGFHAAAHYLHRSQPAITNAVKSLEQQLSLRLFDRTQYHIQLTSQGQAFYKHATALLQHSEGIKQFATALNQGVEPKIVIAIDTILPIDQYAPIFIHMMESFPHTEFQFTLEALNGATELVLEGKADLALTDYIVHNDLLEALPLENIPLVATAARQYAEQHQDKLSNPSRIHECNQIIIRDSSTKEPKQSLGLVNHARHCVVSDIHTKNQFIHAGLGWGRQPEYLIKDALMKGTLVELKADHFKCRDVHLSALRLQQAFHGPVAKAFWQSLCQRNSSIAPPNPAK